MKALHTIRRFLAAIAVVAVCVRALVPVGFMPSWNAQGDDGFALVICTSSGPVEVPQPGSDDGDKPAHAPSTSCPFHLATSDIPAPASALVAKLVQWPAAEPVILASQVATSSLHGLPHPARGPPSHQTL